jgi:hypothetical protein
MLERTTSRNFIAPRRQARKKDPYYFSELGALGVFARDIVFPISYHPEISNMFG